MLKAKLDKASTLQKVVKALVDIVKEANFEFTESGIRVQAMDGAHVAIVLLILNPDGFDEYECDQNITLGLNLKDVLDVLKCANNEDPVYIYYNDEVDSRIIFEFEGNSQIAKYSLSIINLEEESLSVPDMTYATTINMDSSHFQRICRDMKVWGEHVQINTLKNKTIQFQTVGDKGNANITLSSNDGGDEDGTIIEVSEEVEGSFGLNYLNYFTKATPLSDRVSIGLSSGIPLSVTFKIGEKLGEIVFHLAPSAKD